MTYKLYLRYQVIKTYLRHHFYIMITSWSFIHTITFYHHYDTRFQQVSCESRAGYLNKEDYFKINASPGSNNSSVREVLLIIIKKAIGGNHSLSSGSSGSNMREVHSIPIKKAIGGSHSKW